MKSIFRIIPYLLIICFVLINIYGYESSDIFKASIYSITSDENYKYTIELNFEDRIGEKLDYDIEINYPKENEVLASKSFSCKTHCKKSFILKKTYFGKHKIFVNVFYKNKLYSQVLNFDLSKKIRYNYNISLDKEYIVKNARININGSINSSFKKEIVYDFEIFPKSNPKDIRNFSKLCSNFCNFNFVLRNNILIDDYIMRIDSPLGQMQKEFKIKLNENIALNSLGLKKKSGKIILKNLGNSVNNSDEINQNNSLFNNSIQGNQINNLDYFNNSNNLKDLNLNRSLNNSFNNLKDVSEIIKNNIKSNKSISLKKNDGISLENLSITSHDESNWVFFVKEEHLDGSSSFKMIIGDEAKNFTPDKGVVSINKVGTNLRGLKVDTKINSLNLSEIRYKDSSLERINFNNISMNRIKLKSNALVPGIYKEDNLFFGEEYYAIGLLSINTLKPLYHRNEIVEFKLVVLDNNGYPYETNDLILNIKKPNGEFEILSLRNRSILATSKKGVYIGFMNASLVGRYNLYSQAKVGNLIVDVNSYFNVLDFYPFDILRNVPATIDPWSGPFYNNFSIISYLNISNDKEQFNENLSDNLTNSIFNNSNEFRFNLTEKIPIDFFVYENNADILEENGDYIILKWLNLNLSSKPFYLANSPLKSPYLYELGNAEIDYRYNNISYLFNENRTWLFAIDPLLINTSDRTCSQTFNFQCSDWPSSNEGDNTFDSCPTSKGGDGDEYVIEAILNQTEAVPNSNISVSCEFDPYSNGDEEYIYYYDGNSWTQIYSGNSPNGDVHTVTVNTTLSSNTGIEWFRCIIDWDGENDECADGGNWYDNDDVSLKVINPFLTLISPENISYATGSVKTIIQTSSNSNISYSIDDGDLVSACDNCDNFTKREYYTKGSHNILVKAIDDSGEVNFWKEFFYIESSEVNPSINTSDRTCSITFDTDCSLWPSSNETDNTFDSCPTSKGGDGDEYVIEAILNQSNAYINDSINFTCVFNPYSNGDEEYMYYYNGSGWRQLYSGSSPSSDIHNVSVLLNLDNFTGTQWFRCIIDWDGENDECADGGNYFDNDDVSLDVFEYIPNPPFLVSLNYPKNTTYFNTTIPLDFATSRNTSIEYAVDGESFIQVCSNCSSYIGTRDLRVGSHFLELRGYDDINDQYVYRNVSFRINSTKVSAINTSDRTCSITFDTDCSLWPSSDEADNTFDSCPTSKGGSGDEYVIEAILNSSVANVGDDINVTCVFKPYSNGDEEYIYYYNTTNWIQIYSGSAPDSNEHNVSVVQKLSNTSGETTHWFRCIIDWDGENDECADGGNYFDNDDVSLQVIRPVIIKFNLTIYSPLNGSTYASEYIYYDFGTTKNASIKYKLSNETSWTLACDNCSSFNTTKTFQEGNYTLNVYAKDNETGEEIYKNTSFSIKIPKVDNIVFRLPTPSDGSELTSNNLYINTSIYAENSSRFNLSSESNSSVYLVFETSTNETNYTMTCSGTNPDFVCYYEFNNLVNGNYNYSACMKDNLGNITCTEIRSVKILTITEKIFLGLNRIMNRFSNIFNFNIIFSNLNNQATPESKNLVLYSFIPDYFKIENLIYSNSKNYIVNITNVSINSNGVNGSIFQFKLISNNSNNYVFEGYNSSIGFNENNSFNLNINLTGIGNFNVSKILFGFDPLK